MKLVVDSNVLFTFFWRNSVFRQICLRPHVQLITPEYALEEIREHAEEIQAKAHISTHEFRTMFDELKGIVGVIALKEYSASLKATKSLGAHLSPTDEQEFLNDLDFLALALHYQCFLWSNDALLKNQDGVPVLDTKDVITLLAELPSV